MYIQTTGTKKLLQLRKRIKAAQGGTSASKTISILMILADKAESDYICRACMQAGAHPYGCLNEEHAKTWEMRPKLTSIVSESFPHLKRGAMRDFLDIMQQHNYFEPGRWNKTDYIYTCSTGSQIEFFSADQPDKVRGPRRDRLFVNEANNIPYLAFDQLEVRTREEVWLDWNPTYEFWYYTEFKPMREADIDEVILTYKDNEALSKQEVKSIEARRSQKNWWRVYGEGQLGEPEGVIYTGWRPIDIIPHEARLICRGLDFGYTNDPTAIVDVYYYNGGYILNERLYRKGMKNREIAQFINNLEEPNTLVIADSAEPKSIDEINGYGVNIVGSIKGQGSVNRGIDYVQDQKISATKRSLNLWREQRNYMWQTNKDGKTLNAPEEGFNHLMDAARYGIESQKPPLETPKQSVKPMRFSVT